MPFDAIVHAPALRVGARVNIAEADQVEGTVPAELAVGSEVRLRFGVCCPKRSRGSVVALSEDMNAAVLVAGADIWCLQRCNTGGVSTPGLVSDVWFVTERGTQAASPTEHSFMQSSKTATSQG